MASNNSVIFRAPSENSSDMNFEPWPVKLDASFTIEEDVVVKVTRKLDFPVDVPKECFDSVRG